MRNNGVYWVKRGKDYPWEIMRYETPYWYTSYCSAVYRDNDLLEINEDIIKK